MALKFKRKNRRAFYFERISRTFLSGKRRYILVLSGELDGADLSVLAQRFQPGVHRMPLSLHSCLRL